MSKDTLLEQLEKHGNEEDVRNRLAQGKYHSELEPIVKEWLRRKKEGRSSAAAARSEMREEESLSISRRALRNSDCATKIAISAIILSISMIIFEIIKWCSK